MNYDDLNTPGFGKARGDALERTSRMARRAENLQEFRDGPEICQRERVHVDDPEFGCRVEKCAELKIPC